MRRRAIILVACGVVLLAGALGWSTFAVPRLVKFPVSTNTTLQYKGHLVTYVNSTTGAPLAHPTTVPLLVDRHIVAEPASSTSGVAIVKEDLTLHYPGHVVHEQNIYSINRTTMCNVPSRLACTFKPGNPAPSSGSYYVTLPMNIQPGVTHLDIWKPETGTTYPLVPVTHGAPSSTIDGLRTVWFSGTLPMTPVAPYERTALAKRGFPMTVKPSVVESELASDGVSVPTLTSRLLPVLTAAQSKRVAAVLTTPITLNYFAFGTGLVAAETTTGAIIALDRVIDGIAVSPNTSGIKVLVSVLSDHATVAGVPHAIAVLKRLEAAAPQRVYELQYTQTPASVQSMVNTARSELNQLSIVRTDIPVGLASLGGLLLILGVVSFMRRRRAGTGEGQPGQPHAEEAGITLEQRRKVA